MSDGAAGAPTRRLVGGLRLAAHKHISTRGAITRGVLPPELVIALHQHRGNPAVPIVEPGRRVLKGELIGRPGPAPSAAVHASSSGTVVAIEERLFPTGSRLRRSRCVVVATDGEDRPHAQQAPAPWPAGREPQLERIVAGGIAGLGGAAFPTGAKLASAAPCRLLIVNGAECEPYISCDDALMREAPEQIVDGARVLADLTGAGECRIAIERDKPVALAAMRAAVEAAGDLRITVAEVPTVYPAGGERQLIELLTGREVPSGCAPSEVGYVCQNVGTAFALHRLARLGEPLVSRIVTVTGGGVTAPANLEVPIGTPIAHLVERCGGYTEGVTRLIHGGNMMGFALPSDALAVTKATSCIVAATAGEVGQSVDEWACIRCGDCAAACPAHLLPQQILLAARAGDVSELRALGLRDCIECGCCDVVCPSHIALTERFRRAKHAVARHEQRARRSEAAERRFGLKERRLAEERDASRKAQEALRRGVGDDEAARREAIRAAVERAKRRREETR